MNVPLPDIELEGQQLAFYRAIAERDERLASWYYGAHIAANSRGNPEALAQAAHSIRELMDNLHAIVDVPAKAEARRLGDVFATMSKKWERGKRSTKCHADGKWAGELDDAARRAFEAVDAAIEWQQANRPRRKEIHRSTIRGLDVSRQPLPTWIEDTFVDLWDTLRTYFVRVCHHGLDTNHEEFGQAMETLERFVLDRLKPRTFADQEMLDELIRKAESG